MQGVGFEPTSISAADLKAAGLTELSYPCLYIVG